MEDQAYVHRFLKNIVFTLIFKVVENVVFLSKNDSSSLAKIYLGTYLISKKKKEILYLSRKKISES